VQEGEEREPYSCRHLWVGECPSDGESCVDDSHEKPCASQREQDSEQHVPASIREPKSWQGIATRSL
jgi:hypothetical protein